MFVLTAFAFCISLALVGGHGWARESGTNPGQGNTSTTRTNNPDGSTTVTTTTTYKDGSTTTTTNYDKEGHDAGSTTVDKQTKDGETTTTTTTRDGNGHETGKTIERVDKDGNKTIIIIDPATGGVKSSTTVPAEKPKTPPDLPPYKPKWDWKIEPKYNWTPLTRAGYKFEARTSPGVNSEIITTPHGKLIVNVPDELYAGDTFTGTVVTEPAGKTEAERARNQAQLNGIVLDIGQQKTSVAEKIFTRTIPANLTREAQSLNVMVKGETVVNAPVPISGAAPPPPPANVQLPSCGQMGRNVVVRDHCDGIIAPTDSCSIGSTQLQPLAESPRMRVMQNTSEVPGQTEIKYGEQGKQVTGLFQNLGVKLTSPNTNLLRGQKTTLEVVALVQGIQQDVSLDLVNDMPGIVSISGGDNQHFNIHPADVQADGTYHQNFTVTANQAGAWGATATLSCIGASGPQAVATPAGVGAPGPVIIPLVLTPTPTPTPAPAGAHPSPSPTASPGPSPCCPVSPGTYTVTYLGTLPPPDPANASIAVGINDSEDIVGGSWGKFAGYASHAFDIYPAEAPLVAKDDLLWPLDSPSPFGTGGISSFAYGVNASGHVVGKWAIPYFIYPFWFDGVKMHNLETPKYPEGSGFAYAINIDDDVVGVAASGKPSIASVYPDGWAAMWPHDSDPIKDHAMVNLNTLLPPGSGWKLTAAYGINDAKHVVGKGIHLGAIHAFLWLGSGAPIDLGTLGGDVSVAFGLNSSDEVVGYSSVKKAGAFHGFVWKKGVMKDIGTLAPYPNSVAQAINEKGCVVGDVFTGALYKPIFEGGTLAPSSHGVLYSDGVLIDVNTLIPSDSGWEIKTANDINDKCQIVGAGYYKGSKYLTAHVLTPPGVALTGAPKPTPTTTASSCPIAVGSGGYIFNNWNICTVKNSPTKDTTFTLDGAYLITFIATYHWNDGKGALPKKGISLKDSSGKVYGPWDVTTGAGSGGAAHVNWECHPPGIILPAGTYTVVDPDPATWSQNDASGNKGFARVAGSATKK